MRIYSLPRPQAARLGFLLVAPTDRETWSACAACQSGLTTQTRSFREHICRYTGRVSHALYKNSSTLKDRVTECVYSTHIVKAVAEKTRHIASVIITLQVQQLFWDVVTEFFSVAKFRSSALLFLSLMRSARRVKHTTACVLFVAVFFFLRIFATFVYSASQRSGLHIHHEETLQKTLAFAKRLCLLCAS